MKATPFNKTNKTLIGVVVLLVAVFIILIAIQWAVDKDSYSAVYMRTGEIYFGKLVRFPYFGITNVYTIQQTQDAQNPLRVQKFTDVFWGPQDYLKLNHDDVVWYTQLRKDGQLAQLLATNPNLTPPAQQQPTQQELQQYQQQQATSSKSKASDSNSSGQ